MRLFDTSRDDPLTIRSLLVRSSLEAAPDQAEVDRTVGEILESVTAHGDSALLDYTRRFDCPQLPDDGLEVSRAELEKARKGVDSQMLDALEQAALNIQGFHQREFGHLQSWMHVAEDGRFLGQVMRPMRRAGIYAPGGRAAYPSTVLMCAIPARVAGVEEVVVCTPPNRSGKIPPLVAAVCLGWADRVFRIGGAQAIGAMAYGTETVPQVDVVVGPGNRYVNAAKRRVYGAVGIDMLAGPSEVCIIADSGASPRYVAADLLAQIEHGPDNRGVVLTDSTEIFTKLPETIRTISSGLQRQDVLRSTIQDLVIVKTGTLNEAADLASAMAPEHLELQIRDPMSLLPYIRNAGAILMGDSTGAALGDYIAGPSHTLPTDGAARFSSPLSTATFLKRTNVLSYTPGAARLAGMVAGRIADGEGFDGHALSARIRMTEPLP